MALARASLSAALVAPRRCRLALSAARFRQRPSCEAYAAAETDFNAGGRAAGPQARPRCSLRFAQQPRGGPTGPTRPIADSLEPRCYPASRLWLFAACALADLREATSLKPEQYQNLAPRWPRPTTIKEQRAEALEHASISWTAPPGSSVPAPWGLTRSPCSTASGDAAGGKGPGTSRALLPIWQGSPHWTCRRQQRTKASGGSRTSRRARMCRGTPEAVVDYDQVLAVEPARLDVQTARARMPAQA